MKKFLVAASILAMSVGSVSAASLTSVSGSVKINKGEGFVAAVIGQELVAGDKVFVGKGGFAALNFGKCAVTLDKPMVFSVTKAMKCDGNAVIQPTADVVDDVVAPVFPIWPVALVGAGLAGFIAYEALCDDGGASDNGGC